MSRVKEVLNYKKWAVIGASIKENKFGYKVFKRLLDTGYDVTPISPVYKEVLGVKAFKTIEEAGDIDVVLFIVNKDLTDKILNSIDLNNYKAFWFQPNSYHIDTMKKFEENHTLIYGTCILVEKRI